MKSKHKGDPVILFLDEIPVFGNSENWNLDPPGSSSESEPGDTLNLILSINSVSYFVPAFIQKLGNSNIDDEMNAQEVYLPPTKCSKCKNNGFLTKEFHLRYRNSEKIQKLTKFIGHEMKIYISTKLEERSVAFISGEFPVWIDIGHSQNMDLTRLEKALKEMLSRVRQIGIGMNQIRVLFDGRLPKEVVNFLFDHVELKSKKIEVQDEKYYHGCEIEAVIYFGSGHLEAFSRAKLLLFIVTCSFKQEVTDDLIQTISFDDEYLANLRISSTSWEDDEGNPWIGDITIDNVTRPIMEKWKKYEYEKLQKVAHDWYQRYVEVLNRATAKEMLIRIDLDSGREQNMIDNV